MSQAAPSGSEHEQPDLRAVARTTAVVVAVVVLCALIVTLLALAGHIFLVGFLGILVAVTFDTIGRPIGRLLHLQRKHSFALVVLVAFLLAGAGAVFAGGKVYAQVDQLAAHSSEAYTFLQAKAAELPRPLGSGKKPASGGDGTGSGAAEESGKSDEGSTPTAPPELIQGAVKIASVATEIASSLLLMVLMSLFFGYSPEEYVDALIDILPQGIRFRSWALAKAVHADLKQWLFGQLTTMCVNGVFVFVGLMIAGVKLAPVLGLVAGLCSFVPYIGSFVAPIPGVLTVLGDDGPSKLPILLGVYAAAEFLEGWIVTPLIQKQRSHIPPALLVFFQALMGIIAGPLGIVISTPLLVVIMTCVRELMVERSKA